LTQDRTFAAGALKSFGMAQAIAFGLLLGWLVAIYLLGNGQFSLNIAYGLGWLSGAALLVSLAIEGLLFKPAAWRKPPPFLTAMIVLGLVIATLHFFLLDGRLAVRNASFRTFGLCLGFVAACLFALRTLSLVQMAGLLIAVSAIAVGFALVDFGFGLPTDSGRLEFNGRVKNPITGSAGLVPAALAIAILICRARLGRNIRLLLSLAGLVLAAGLLLAQSRGVWLSMLFGGAGFFFFWKNQSAFQLRIALLACWALMTMIVIIEPVLRASICSLSEQLCRDPQRLEIWFKVWTEVWANPLVGKGAAFRFPNTTTDWHAHNGIFSTALLYGVPMALMLFAMVMEAAKRVVDIENNEARIFAAALLCFSMSFFGSNQANPFGLALPVYFYFVLPLTMAYMLPKKRSETVP
jgi:hypothetical protein